jgi:hypothetical protein
MKKTRDLTERLGRIVAGLPRQKKVVADLKKRPKVTLPPEPSRACGK